MTSFEQLRTTSHELLLALDAATTKMMMLVSAKEVSGPFWDGRVCRASTATSILETEFTHWHEHLTELDYS